MIALCMFFGSGENACLIRLGNVRVTKYRLIVFQVLFVIQIIHYEIRSGVFWSLSVDMPVSVNIAGRNCLQGAIQVGPVLADVRYVRQDVAKLEIGD
jgi:hypothetical protein